MCGFSRFPLFTVIALAAIAIGVFAGLLLGNSLPPPARAASTSHLTTLYIQEDRFRNYDFNSKTDSSSNVDWALSMLFYNDAEVDKVKDILSPPYNFSGGSKYARLDEGSGWLWDKDGGRKDIYCPSYQTEARHMRIYADSNDRLYNVSWGYYVLASTHKDWQECWFGSEFGWSEETEDIFADFLDEEGYTVFEDWNYWYNYEGSRWEGNHYWSNNGYATAVYVP